MPSLPPFAEQFDGQEFAMRLPHSLSLKQRLSLVMTIGFLLVAVTLVAVGHFLTGVQEQEFESAYIDGLEGLWSAVSENERNAMAGNFTALTRNRKLSGALFKGSREKVVDAIGPTATRLEAMDIADNLMVVGKDGQIYFSLQEGVTQVPALAQKALESAKPVAGFELTPDGRLKNLVAYPILDRADLVGVGIFEKGLKSPAEKIKAASGREILMLDMQGGMVSSTLEHTLQLPPFTAQEGVGRYAVLTLAEGVFGYGMVTLSDSLGKPAAVVVSIEDVGATVALKSRYQTIGMVVGMAILLLLITALWFYLKHALKPLDVGVMHMRRIADGDLSLDIEHHSRDEFKQLLDAMQTMNGDLRRLVGKIADTSGDLGSTVVAVDQAASNTNEAARRQRQELDHLATAITEMTATADSVAVDINELAAAADESMRKTEEGDRVVQHSLEGIGNLTKEIRYGSEVVAALEEKSQQIGVVIDVIKNIAEQTNLLALNAAIEAARAGEQGRGFAVVADEVRTLAGRTQDSTKQIESIITDLQSGVGRAVVVMADSAGHAEEASTQAATIGDTLGSVRGRMEKINMLSSQVATAADQQSKTTSEMNQNVQRISDDADSTSSQAESTSEIVARLVTLSSLLSKEMEHFKTG
jgi:methyl-accepting chemotaxis protein